MRWRNFQNLFWLFIVTSGWRAKLSIPWLILRIIILRLFKLPAKGGLISFQISGETFWVDRNDITSLFVGYPGIVKDQEYLIHPEILPEEPGVVIDVGANIGMFSYWVRRLVPKAKIIAFEPNPIAFTALQWNVRLIKNNIVLINQMVADRQGMQQFEIVRTNSLIGAAQIKDYQIASREMRRIKVKTTTLDQIKKTLKLARVELLKIDVEGSEIQVLSGAKKLLKHTRKVIVEYHGTRKEALSLLKKSGFKIRKITSNEPYGLIFAQR